MPTAPAGTLYRGREGMWSWVAHRVTGVLIFFFLLVHILDTALVRVSPEAYNAVIGTYQTPIMGLGGGRPRRRDRLPRVQRHPRDPRRLLGQGPKYQKAMLWVVVGLFVVTMAGFLPRHLMNVFGGGH